jgi:type I restriction enzyme M protein
MGICQTLRDDEIVGYGDYLEQLTYLLFSMADEYSKPPHNEMPTLWSFAWET